MLNVRFIVKMLGVMFILETFFMLAATVVAFLYRGSDVYPLLISSGILFGTGFLFYSMGFKANEHSAGRREGMLIVTLTWILFSLFGMLPFYIGGYIDNVTDAFFETMSGFTTTGSTILTNIEALPKGILFWRSLTQWQGGIGMVVFTVALMPIFGGGASQMFDAETPGITHERFRPRITQVAKRLWGVYVFLTLFLVGLLWAGPMNLYDAVNHAFTAISTGGYSTKNASIAYWNSSYIEYVITIFMFIGATNMTLVYFCFNGNVKKLIKDEEFRPFFWFIALILMFICGCAGSTCGGLKMGRFVILTKNLSNEFKKQTHPHAVIPVRMNGHVVSGDIVHRVLAFVFAYITLIVVSCLALSLDGMGFSEAIGAAVSAISNVGPGLGTLGPVSNFADVPTVSKWFLSFLMLTGRLEIFTVLTILVPGFWKQ